MKIEETPINRIKPYENNPRNITEDAIEKVANSIQEFGFQQPIVVDKDNVIIVGHTRLLAAKKIGLKTVPVIIADDLTDEQVKAYRLADNKTGELAGWDFTLLDEELKDIFDLDMSDFGFDLSGIEEPQEIVEDEVPEVNEQADPICKFGDVWELGKHRLMCGDSTNSEMVEKLMDGQKADISFTSPPYNAGKTPSEIGSKKESKYLDDVDNKSDTEYRDFLIDYLNNAIKNSKFTFMNIQSLSNNKRAIIEVLYNFRDLFADTIIWDKQHGQPAMYHNVLNSVFEYVHVFSEEATRVIGTVNFRGTLDNIVRINAQRDNEFSDIHNATFSVEFASYFVNNFAESTVLDLFGGTGTTLIACEQSGKKCYMMELDPHYCDVILQRYINLKGSDADVFLLKEGKKVPYSEACS